MARQAWFSMGAALVFAAAAGALAPGCLETRDDPGALGAEGRCATCHGDPARSGTFLQRAAPPSDQFGASRTGYPGVGAHFIHVYASETHGAVACSECHVVPRATASPGHVDDPTPAELVFGPIARQDGREPAYGLVSRRCSDTYCHRQADAVWTAPKSSEDACGTCHGLPPPPPHPQSERCDVCHGEVIDSERRFKAPELHVDGNVQVASQEACTGCHGDDQSPAPPPNITGQTALAAIGVGAHRAHLAGGNFSRAVSCNECHVVPASVDSPGHADALPAEVVFAEVATSSLRAPTWDRASTTCSETWCHGPSSASLGPSPSWVVEGALGCTSCHGTPPPAPHPELTDCSRCHGAVVGEDDTTILERARHVDGTVDVAFDEDCTACHGSANPAPPLDVGGSSSTSSPGVGAHQTHVLGTSTSRPVPCAECHRVPAAVLATGHLDTPLPAEVSFSGAAAAFGAAPAYMGGSCEGTPCHGATFPEGHASGGGNTTPVWTQVDGTQAPCGACHGLPPPRPHPVADLNPVCSVCHENAAPDNVSFVRPELHVDGIVTFTVP